MLRNVIHGSAGETYFFLNEVLSLNAQEYYRVTETGELEVVLNEVLSLNAQELTGNTPT